MTNEHLISLIERKIKLIKWGSFVLGYGKDGWYGAMSNDSTEFWGNESQPTLNETLIQMLKGINKYLGEMK